MTAQPLRPVAGDQSWAPRIHPSAVVSPGAELGPGVEVGPFCYIEAGVAVGARSRLGPHVCLLSGTRLGSGCLVHAHAVLGDLPQDLTFNGGHSRVEIGDDCVIREGVTVHRGTAPGTVTEVGTGSLLMANSHVGHNARVGQQVVLANGALLAGYSEVGDRAFISGNCLVHQYTRVGRLAMMSGGSAAQMDVPPFCITRSLAANTVMGLNVIGLRRAGFSPADRQALKQAFDLLYRAGLGVSAALATIEGLPANPAVLELLEFVRNSRRGICKLSREPDPGAGDATPLAA